MQRLSETRRRTGTKKKRVEVRSGASELHVGSPSVITELLQDTTEQNKEEGETTKVERRMYMYSFTAVSVQKRDTGTRREKGRVFNHKLPDHLFRFSLLLLLLLLPILSHLRAHVVRRASYAPSCVLALPFSLQIYVKSVRQKFRDWLRSFFFFLPFFPSVLRTAQRDSSRGRAA